MKFYLCKSYEDKFMFSGRGIHRNILFYDCTSPASFSAYDDSEKSGQWLRQLKNFFLKKSEANYSFRLELGDESILCGQGAVTGFLDTPQQYVSVSGNMVEALNVVCKDLRIKVTLQDSMKPSPIIAETNAIPVAFGRRKILVNGQYTTQSIYCAEQSVILPASWCNSRRGHILAAWSEEFQLKVSIEASAKSFNLETSPQTLHSRKSAEAKRFCITKKILSEEIDADSVLVANCGTEIKCHKCFLSAQSPVLARMFQGGFQESKTCRINIVDMTVGGIKAFLEYVYNWEISLAEKHSQIALELLEAGHKYDMTALEEEMRALFLEKPNEYFGIDVALKLFVLARNVEGL